MAHLQAAADGNAITYVANGSGEERVAGNATAFTEAHAADESAAEADLAAYYARELNLADPAGAARAAIGQVVDKAFAGCS